MPKECHAALSDRMASEGMAEWSPKVNVPKV